MGDCRELLDFEDAPKKHADGTTREALVYKISSIRMLENEGFEKDPMLAGKDSTLGENNRRLEKKASINFSYSSTFWVGSGL